MPLSSAFLVTLRANVDIVDFGVDSREAVAVTLDVIDVIYTGAVSLTGAVIPSENLRFGDLTLESARSAAEQDYHFVSDNPAVSRDSDGALRYTGAITRGESGNLDTGEAIAEIMISRGETGGEEVVRPLPVSVFLRGCYRSFADGTAEDITDDLKRNPLVTDVVQAGGHELFLHRESDNAYLSFDEINETGAVFAGEVLAAGHVLSIVPTGYADSALADAANFYRVYQAQEGGAAVLRIAVEDAIPQCELIGSGSIRRLNRFYLGETWEQTNRANARIIFPAPVADGTVME